MADIESLGYPSISDMDNDEAIDLLRQIRLSRRVPEKRAPKQESVKVTRTKATAAVTSNMAEELLKILGGM
jgi:hypothetical protein